MSSSTPNSPSLQTTDYVVFGAQFIFTMAIGVYYAVRGRGTKSRESYFVGNRKMHFVPVALSLVVSYESSIMMLGLPTEVYMYGTGTVFVAFSYLVSNLLASVVSVPLFKPLRITSVFEYIQLRFESRRIRIAGVICSVCNVLFYMGVVIYAQAVALEAVMGLNMWLSVVVMTACAVLYTSLGGIKSVVWTDVFQSVIMFGGVFAIIIKGTTESGGVRNVLNYARNGERLMPFDFNPDPTTRHATWLVIPKILAGCSIMFEQSLVQRVSASRSVQDAKYMMYLSSAVFLSVYLVVVCEGLVLYAFYSHRGKDEPMTCDLIKNTNQIVPYSVLILFESLPGMAGLFLAALYSASLSTVSSGLNSVSVLITQDLLEPYLRTTSDVRATLYAKISVVVLGGFCLLFCFVVSFFEGSFTQVFQSIMAASSAPLAGLFILACFFPSSHAKGAAIGMLLGFTMSGTLTMGTLFRDDVRKHPPLPLVNGTCSIDELFASTLTSTAVGLVHNVTTTAILPTSNTLLQFTPTIESLGAGDTDQGYNWFFSLSYILFMPMGILVTVLTGLLASHIMGPNKPGDVDPRYFLDLADSVFVLLPESFRRWMRNIGPDFRSGWKNSSTEGNSNELEHLPTSNI